MDKDNVTAIFGTVIIHLVALILLYFGVLRTFVPIDDGGIPVRFGDFYASTVVNEPPPAAVTPASVPPATVPPQRQPATRTTTTPAPKAETKPITQNKDETVSVPETKKETPVVNEKAQNEEAERKLKEENQRKQREAAEQKQKEENERKQREELERKQKEEAERKQREEAERKRLEAIDNRVANAFGSGSAQDGKPGGATTGSLDPGNPFGSANASATLGAPGIGKLNLGNRYFIENPKPVYTENVAGTIVIRITVDSNGNVINALTELNGTNIADPTMRQNAENAAKRAKINKIPGGNNESGTITYNFRLN